MKVIRSYHIYPPYFETPAALIPFSRRRLRQAETPTLHGDVKGKFSKKCFHCRLGDGAPRSASHHHSISQMSIGVPSGYQTEPREWISRCASPTEVQTPGCCVGQRPIRRIFTGFPPRQWAKRRRNGPCRDGEPRSKAPHRALSRRTRPNWAPYYPVSDVTTA